MKFKIFVFACVIASAISMPATDNSPIKVNLSVELNDKSDTKENVKEEPTTEILIDSSTTISSIDATTTDASSTISSELTTVVTENPETTTAAIDDATLIEQKETTEVPTTETPTTEISSTKSPNAIISLQTKLITADIEAENASIKNEGDKVVEKNKDKSDTSGKAMNKETKPKIRGSIKFGSVKVKEEESKDKTKLESVKKPIEKTESTVEVNSIENEAKGSTNKNKVAEKNSSSKVEKKLQKNQKVEKSIESSVDVPSDRKIVPAIPQPRTSTKTNGSPSAEERRKGRKYKDIQIVQLESELEENGKYRFNYEGEDGTVVNQSGELKMMDTEGNMGESVQGSYSYKDENTGETYEVKYTADENGYRPVGAHIPTIPPYIARALAWQATAKPWVDPWLVKQENLRKARKAKELQSTN